MAQFFTIDIVNRRQSIQTNVCDCQLRNIRYKINPYADMAQLAEQLICNQQVIGSSPIVGSYGPLAQLVRATGS